MGLRFHRCANLPDAALIPHHDAACRGHRRDQVMGAVDHGCGKVVVQVGMRHPPLFPQHRVKVGQRLLKLEHLGVANQHPTFGNARALAAQQQGGPAVQQVVKLPGAAHPGGAGKAFGLGLAHRLPR